jgi:hypothetical protein
VTGSSNFNTCISHESNLDISTFTSLLLLRVQFRHMARAAVPRGFDNGNMAKNSPGTAKQDDLAAVSAAALPIHPVAQLQGPFEESILESMNNTNERQEKVDSITRRKQLLERENYERTCAGRWKKRPGENFHPLWKLVAQISFGMHLLGHGLAKSEEEVMKILQTHVDEIDGFLELTTEDFELAQKDIQDRIQLLRVPLENLETFDTMLEGRDFRLSIVEGNEKIEHIVSRTSQTMNDALKDVQKGIDATKGLEKYLAEMNMGWDERSQGLDAVYQAMMGNVEGWRIAFIDLQMKGNSVGVALVQLGGIISEMSKRAGIASRKMLVGPIIRQVLEVAVLTLCQSSPLSPPVTKMPLQRISSNKALRVQSPALSDKPLPEAPDPVEEAVQATLPRRHADHKVVRRTPRNAPRMESSNNDKRNSQIRNSKSFPEISQAPQRHVSILDNRGRSATVLRRLSNKRMSVQTTTTPKPSPPAKDMPKNLSRKSSIFSSKSTTPDVSKTQPARLQKRSGSFPPPTQEPVTSEDESEAATSVSAAPAPFVPIRRPRPNFSTGDTSQTRRFGGRPLRRMPVVVVDDTSTTTYSAPSENYFSTAEDSDGKTDSPNNLPQGRLENAGAEVRRVVSLVRRPAPPKRSTSLRTPQRRVALFPVKSFEHLKIIGEKSSPSQASPPPPRPSSTPPFTDKTFIDQQPSHRPQHPPPSFPTPRALTDSGKNTFEDVTLASSLPDSPDSLLTALPSLLLRPRGVKKSQPKSAVAHYTNTSTELLELLASPPPFSPPINSPSINKRHDHPNPLRSHTIEIPARNDTRLGDEPRSPPPPGPGGPAMVHKDITSEANGIRSGGGSKKGLKRIFTRNRGSKRMVVLPSDKAGIGLFKGMDKDGVWVARF